MPIITKYLTMHQLNENYTLLINSLSGALDILDIDGKQKMEKVQKGETIEDQEFITLLADRGYLFENEEAELKTLEKNKNNYDTLIEKMENKITFVICPTMACNLKCIYCFESDSVKNNNQIMKEEQLENIFKIIDQIRLERKPKNSNLNLFGGEPLLPSTLAINEKIFEYAYNKKMSLTITSNGTHILAYKNLFEKYKDFPISLQITVDGVEDVHNKRRVSKDNKGTFSVICEGIDFLLSLGIQVNVRVNIDKQNIDRLNDFIQFIKDKGWDQNKKFYCDIAPILDHAGTGLIPNFMSEDEIVKKIAVLFPNYAEDESFFKMSLFKILHHVTKALNFMMRGDNIFRFHYCEANIMKFFVFAPNGYIYACPESVGSEECIVGTFGSELTLYPEKVKEWMGRNIFRMPKCKDCKVALFCGGGCAMAAIKTNGNIDNPVCNNAELVLSEYIQSVKDKIIAKYCS